MTKKFHKKIDFLCDKIGERKQPKTVHRQLTLHTKTDTERERVEES